jgi:hypothetical protein
MSAPYFGMSTDPDATVTVQAPLDEDTVTQRIVEILLAGYAIKKTAALIAALVPGISLAVWASVISETGGSSGHTAHARLNAHELAPDTHGADVARSAARREVLYRAAYIARAAARVQTDVHEGTPLHEALAREVKVFRTHEAARRNRLDAATKVGIAANRFGPLLGWYLDPVLNNEPECIAANGHNFYAAESTVIGDPGAVHRFCGCTAGPPIPGASMVNEAIAASRRVVFATPKRYGLRKAG